MEYVFHPNVTVVRELAREMEEKIASIVIQEIWHVENHWVRKALQSINIGFTSLKFTREERLSFVSALFGREMTSTKDLTIGEAQALRMTMLGDGYVVRPQFIEIVEEWRIL